MKSIEDKLLGQLYCFCGGGDDADDGDTGDTGVSASVAAGGRGWGPSRGPDDRDESSNDDQDRRVQSTGSTTNFNIDRSQPSVVADVNGTQRTVYGTQANLDSAIASGDLNPVGNVQDNYTPGTQEAAQAYNAVIADQEDALGFAPGAAAGPALAGIDTTDPFQTMQFGTPITAQAFSPVARAMSPFERTLAAASRPQTADEKLADLARTDRAAALQQYLDVNPNQSLSYANTYLNALVKADDRAEIPSSPEFDQRAYSPVDAVNIFDQFEQPLGANNLPTGQLSIMQATPITASVNAPVPGSREDLARRAAEQFTSRRNTPAEIAAAAGTKPTPAEVAAAEQRLTSRTPGLQAAIAEGIMPANIEGQYGMQPTTSEVDAYNAALNAEIADQLGIGTYNPVTYGAPSPISQVSTDPITQQDYANLAAGRGVIQGDMGVINQAAQEVALETGVSPQVAAQATGIVGANPQLSSTVLGTGSAYPSGQTPDTGASLRAEEMRDRMAAEMAADQRLTGAQGAATEILGGYDRAMAEQRAIANRDQMAAEMAAEAEQATRAAEQQADADQFMDVSAIDVTQPGPEFGGYANETQQRAADYLKTMMPNLTDAQIQRAIVDPEYYTKVAGQPSKVGDEEQGLFMGDLQIAAINNPLAQNPLEGVPYLNTIGAIGTDIYNSFANRDAYVQDMIDKGAQPILDSDGFIIGAYDREGNRVMSRPGEMFSEEMSDYYGQQREQQEAEQARQDSGGDQIAAPAEEKPAEETPEEYEGKQIVKPYQYQPRGPLSYAYTGLPSLAPQKLRPSYRAPKTFSPLFPVS